MGVQRELGMMMVQAGYPCIQDAETGGLQVQGYLDKKFSAWLGFYIDLVSKNKRTTTTQVRLKEDRIVSISRCHRHRRRGRRSSYHCHSKSCLPDPAVSGETPWEAAVLKSSWRIPTGRNRGKSDVFERLLVRVPQNSRPQESSFKGP